MRGRLGNGRAGKPADLRLQARSRDWPFPWQPFPGTPVLARPGGNYAKADPSRAYPTARYWRRRRRRRPRARARCNRDRADREEIRGQRDRGRTPRPRNRIELQHHADRSFPRHQHDQGSNPATERLPRSIVATCYRAPGSQPNRLLSVIKDIPFRVHRATTPTRPSRTAQSGR